MPKNVGWPRIALPLIVVVASVAGVRGQDRNQRTTFMREKLDNSKEILDGLTKEDFAQIGKAARALRAMKEMRTWTSPTHPEAARLRQYALEFEELTEALIARAEEKNLDGATKTFLRLTSNCVNCHKELRSRRK